MTHEEYLCQLIRGFAGEGSVRQPMYSGSNEADAVARWLAYNVAHHAVTNCPFDPLAGGRIVHPAVRRVWRRWETDRQEDVDMELLGWRGRTPAVHSVKVVVNPGDTNRYFLRLSDYRMNRWLDVNGARRDEAGGRILIDEPMNPIFSTIQRPRPARRPLGRPTLRLAPCCVTSRRNIDIQLEHFGLAGGLMVVAGLAHYVDVHPSNSYMLLHNDWDAIANATRALDEIGRQRCIGIITEEIASHPSGPLRVYWENMDRSFRSRRRV